MKIRVYEDGNEINTLTEHLEKIFNESEFEEAGRKIFGTDEMFDVNDFYQYELMDDGTIRKNFYDTEGVEIDCIDYDNPERVEETDLTWVRL
jgi:hypothetical protein